MSSQRLRLRVAACLDARRTGDRLSQAVDLFLIALISLNVVAIVAESVPSLSRANRSAFDVFERFSVAVFTVEYLLRIWSAPDSQDTRFSDTTMGRLRFALTPAAIVDLLAIAPYYLSMFFGMDLRFLRVIRLLRVFKLTRYSATVQMILSVFRAEASAFIASFALMLVLLVLASSGIYLIEHQVQPDKFGSIPAAMWWAMATLTTVGYGDTIPITALGKFFGGCITLIGVGMVALPAGILASSFSEQLRRQRETYSSHIASALSDGVVDAEEAKALEDLRQRLGKGRLQIGIVVEIDIQVVPDRVLDLGRLGL
ncbi:MAG: ion transporter, partial [Pseudomonadales bacterium]|nr:ion transporter [Pseudomonadales bacterium]